MTFNAQLSVGTAVALALIAAFMWGTWPISVKFLGDYPIDAFYITLFVTSFVFVWVVGLLVERAALFENIQTVWATEPSRVLVTFVCGIIYVLGIRLSLAVINLIGLSLSQPLQSSTLNLASLAVTIVVGGVPQGVSIPLLVLATLILITAVFVSLLAGHFRSQVQGAVAAHSQYVPMSAVRSSLGLVLLSSLLIVAYPFALSFGMRSTTQLHGLAVLPFMAVLASGAMLGSLLSSGSILTIRHQWHRVWHAGFRIHKLGLWSGFFHYGGNIIQAFAASFLSTALAFPLGITASLWTQTWGLVLGEFRDSPPRAYVALFGGVVLYIAGAYIIAVMLH
jgi:hypothetical protein